MDLNVLMNALNLPGGQARRADIIVVIQFYYTPNPEGGDIKQGKINNVTLSGFDIDHLYGLQ